MLYGYTIVINEHEAGLSAGTDNIASPGYEP